MNNNAEILIVAKARRREKATGYEKYGRSVRGARRRMHLRDNHIHLRYALGSFQTFCQI